MTTAKLAVNSVLSNNILDGSITSAKLAPEAVGKFSVDLVDNTIIDISKNISILKNSNATTIQSPSGGFSWARVIKSDSKDRGNGIAVDFDGNVYITGSYTGTAAVYNGTTILHTLPASLGGSVSFIIKLNATGDFDWARVVDNMDADRDWNAADAGFGIATDAGGNVYITGTYHGTASVYNDTTILHTLPVSKNEFGSHDSAFIVKLNTTGDFVWARVVDGNFRDSGRGIATDPLGNVYIIGYYEGISTGVYNDTTLLYKIPDSYLGGISAFIVKLNATGDFGWARIVDGTNDVGYGITTDADGNVYITGYYDGTASVYNDTTILHTLPASLGSAVAFIVKLNATGDFSWARVIDGAGGDYGRGIAADSSGNVYITGMYNGTASVYNDTTILHTLPASLGNAGFIVKLNATGDFGWARIVDGTGGDVGYGITTDADGNVYITGYYHGTASVYNDTTILHTLPASLGGSVAFIIKMNTTGDFSWARVVDGTTTGFDVGNGIAVDANGNVYITGYYNETAGVYNGTTLLYTLPASLDNTAFIIKLDAGGTVTSVPQYSLPSSLTPLSTGFQKTLINDSEPASTATVNVINNNGTTVKTLTIQTGENAKLLWVDNKWLQV